LVGECLPVSRVEICWPTCDQALAAQSIQQIPGGESLANIRIGVQVAAGIESCAPFRNHLRSERDISGDHQISWCNHADNVLVCDVHSLADTDAADERRRWSSQGLIGDECHQDLAPLRSAIQQLLDFGRTPVGVNPNLHVAGPSSISEIWDANGPFFDTSARAIITRRCPVSPPSNPA